MKLIRALAGARHGGDTVQDDDGDDGLEHIRQRHRRELALKEHQFQQSQALLHQAHEQKHAAIQQANMQKQMAMIQDYHQKAALKIHHHHLEFGDASLHELAQGFAQGRGGPNGAQHLMGIAHHLHQSGAPETAKILLAHASNKSG